MHVCVKTAVVCFATLGEQKSHHADQWNSK